MLHRTNSVFVGCCAVILVISAIYCVIVYIMTVAPPAAYAASLSLRWPTGTTGRCFPGCLMGSLGGVLLGAY
jgi:hypothetical protein